MAALYIFSRIMKVVVGSILSGSVLRALLMLLALLAINSLNAQNNHLPGLEFEKLKADNGLTSDYVLSIFQDKKGFLWVGTTAGLNRYDGYNIKTFEEDKSNANAISSNIVSAITEDIHGKLWIGTRSAGINMFDPETEDFISFKNDIADTNSLSENYITALFIDSKNRLWVSCQNSLNVADLDDATTVPRFHRIKYGPGGIDIGDAEIIRYIVEDKEEGIWISCSSNEIMKLDPASGSYKFKTIAKGRCLKINPVGELWYSNVGYMGKLAKTGKNYDEVRYPMINALTKEPLGIMDISMLLFDTRGNIWITTNHSGVYTCKINEPNKTLDIFRHSTYNNFKPQGISSNLFIAGGIIDRSNVLWLGSEDAGLNKYNIEKKQFTHVQHGSAVGELPFACVRSICEDDDSNIWIGSQGDGLALLPGNTFNGYYNTFVHVLPQSLNGRFSGVLPVGSVLSIFDMKGQKYPGTFFGVEKNRIYIDQINSAGPGVSFKSFTGNNEGYILTMDIHADNCGHVLYAEYSGGILDFKLKENGDIDSVFKHLHNDNDPNTIASNIVRSIAQTPDGVLWFGTSDGLCRAKRKFCGDHNLKFYTYKNEADDSTSLSNNYILPLFVSKAGELWIGTLGGGLNKFIAGEYITEGKFISYTTKNGLPSNIVKAILEDDKGYLWISTTKGMAKFNPVTGEFLNFDVNDGLQGNDFSDLSACKTTDGRMMFGGTNGISIFFPDSIKENPYKPKVAIVGLNINNKHVNIGQKFGSHIVLPKAIQTLNHITITYRERVIEFEFAALHFANPARNRYQYMLSPLDKEWVETDGEKRYAKYTDLQGGEYTFKVKAANLDGVWYEVPLELNISIIPPFWKTWWFYCIGGLFLAGILVLTFYFRTTQIKHRNLELEKEVTLRTREIKEKSNVLARQAEELSETNTELEERQQRIEEQAEELTAQRDDLYEANTLLLERQHEIEFQRNKLEEANRVKDKLFTIVAHDLKNPFNTLAGFLEILQAKYDKYTDDKRKLLLGHAVDSVGAIQNLLVNLLSWARAQTGSIKFNPSASNIVDHIQGNVDLVLNQLQAKNINVSFNSTLPSIIINIDTDLINTVLRNLLTNAIKFTKPGGKIEVECSLNNTEVTISVKDDGVGISAENIQKLFKNDVHFTTYGTENEKGTGLGLTTCKDFIEMHKGTISVESEEGRGATFKLTLPIMGPQDQNMPLAPAQ